MPRAGNGIFHLGQNGVARRNSRETIVYLPRLFRGTRVGRQRDAAACKRRE